MIYSPLHVHTDASSDGAGTVDALIQRAADIGCTSLAMTDHGTLANSVSFWSACKDAGIKPILGQESYLLYNGKRHHVTLLSRNEAGFNNLIALSSHAHTERHSGGFPLITLDDMDKWGKGLLALTGCAASALYVDQETAAFAYVQDLVEAMGKENVFAEMMFVGTQDTWSRPLAVAKHLDIPWVVTNDSHFPCQDQYCAHQVITQVRKGFTYNSEHLWLKSGDEILAAGERLVNVEVINSGLYTSNKIADSIESWDMGAAPTLPHIPDAQVQLEVALRAALHADCSKKRNNNLRASRLKYEFHILKEKNFLDYIYILWDIIKWAKSQGIAVGPGRGSGGGSYVLYLLGVTRIDPLEYGLLFERFINPSRADYPDVDVDFESDRRQEVVNYAHDKWGTIPIATYSTYSHKSAIHDIARILKVPKVLEIAAADSTEDSDAFRKFMSFNSDALTTYNTMIGQIRHRGKHAAGVIVANRPVPLEKAGDEIVAAWAEGGNSKDLSQVGVVKFDLLGLTALSQLSLMEKLTKVAPPTDFEDPAVFDLFCTGDVGGIFQFTGSEGIKELTIRVAPRKFIDLATINALYRPGPLGSGLTESYPELMKSPRKLHPRIDKHLESTYGVICYQEQVMQVVAEVGGFPFEEADDIRRLISKAKVGDKKWEKEFASVKKNFMVLGQKNGFDIKLLYEVWSEINTHSGYSFNLSHASAYTMISYQMAWYKVYHRPAFVTAMLQYDRANAQAHIFDAVGSGLEISTPHINVSGSDFALVGDTIYLPLSDVNFVGEKAVAAILEELGENGKFESYEDFASRITKRQCNNRSRTMLERIGAFKGLTGNPASAIDKYDEIPVAGDLATQLECLGYIIPSATLLKKIKYLRERPCRKNHQGFAGFITGVTNKKNDHGSYTVYHLSPFGSFWARESDPRLKTGVFVAGTKSEYGRSKDVKRYRMGDGS